MIRTLEVRLLLAGTMIRILPPLVNQTRHHIRRIRPLWALHG